jgi:outer membrane receptor protein involved in Fe transport
VIHQPHTSPARSLALGILITLAALPAAPIALGAAPAQLEEIVVTAARRPVPLLQTPLSISRIGADDIVLTGATHSSEALNRVPGVMIQRGSGQESLTAIRSPVLTGAGSCGAFLFLENGVPIRPVGFCNVNDLFEINTEQADAIEVIRGTGSALYGSNAVHGTVNVLQAAPAERPALQGALDMGPAHYERVEAAGRHDGDRTDFGARGFYAHDGGWRDSSGFDEAKLNATLTSTWTATPVRFDLAATDLNQETAGFITGKDAYQDEEIARSNPNPEAFRDAHAVRLTGLIEPQPPLQARLELRPYLRTSRMEFLQHFLLGQPLERNGQESAGLMSTLTWDTHEAWSATAGADLEWARSFLFEFQAQPTTGGSPAANAIRPAGKHYDYDVDSNVAALYGQVVYRFAGRWHVGAGARAEYVAYDYDNRMLAGNTADNGVPCGSGGCLYSRPADRRDTFCNVAPKITLSVDIVDGLSAYANVSRGFRPPEMTELYRLQRMQTVAGLDSERLDSAEIGLKGSFETVRFSLAAFDMDKSNVILRESNGFNVSNGRTSHRGVEYDLQWNVIDSLTLAGGGTYARHRYEFSRAVEGGETITDGDDIDTAPRELMRAALQWRPVAAIATEAEWLRVGDYWLDAANVHRYPGHELLNVRASWAFTSQWSATLRLNNALDAAYADRADFAFGTYRYFPGRGRTLFAELAWTSK